MQTLKRDPVTLADASKLLRVHQFAKRIGVSIHTVYNWMASGKIPHHKVGGHYRIHPDAMKGTFDDTGHLQVPAAKPGTYSNSAPQPVARALSIPVSKPSVCFHIDVPANARTRFNGEEVTDIAKATQYVVGAYRVQSELPKCVNTAITVLLPHPAYELPQASMMLLSGRRVSYICI